MSKRSFPLRPTGAEIRNLEQPGHYPQFSTLQQKKAWDETTRRVIDQRVNDTPPIRFFCSQEQVILAAIIDRVLPQDDRSQERTIPILPVIDERLFTNALNGFRYEDMPPDQEAYRLGLRAIEEMSAERFDAAFSDLTIHRQELILKSLHDGKPDPPHDVWTRMPVHRFWALLMEDSRDRLLRASVGLGRNRFRRTCVSTRLHAARKRAA